MLVVRLIHETHNDEISLIFIEKASSLSVNFYESLIKNVLSSSEDLKLSDIYSTGEYAEFSNVLDILDKDLKYIGIFEFSTDYFYDDLIDKIAMEYAFNANYSTALDGMIEKFLNSPESRHNDPKTVDTAFRNYQKILERAIVIIDNYREMVNTNYHKLKEHKNNKPDQGE